MGEVIDIGTRQPVEADSVPQRAVVVIVKPSAPIRVVILLSQIVGGALAGWLAVAWAMG
ncbi:hypothetical protein OEZ49_22505 [Ruegeria sp. WL0004]|uniref:MFS transporter n=1 Tax=Ruegeria marisflavi TaxID=2984152 RepID=A0ABT2WX94_9RHOB|nr:hypothetical protein [Ruegeria sp. WL0004]MCU9840524.1 hypothetical protein [Ruegeria sp. WL0004]